MPEKIDLDTLLLWAAQCGTRAADTTLAASERERLLKMQEAILQLAENHGWLRTQLGHDLPRNESDRGDAAES